MANEPDSEQTATMSLDPSAAEGGARTLMSLRDIVVGYGATDVLHGVSMDVKEAEVTLVLGHNGAGKSTIPRAVMGLLPFRRGTLEVDGRDLTTAATSTRVRAGIAFVPQSEGLFRSMTVVENLRLAAFQVDRETTERQLARVVELFPALEARWRSKAGLLSGGEQKLLSLGMALMVEPKLLLVDEPSIGLSPRMIDVTMSEIRRLAVEFGLTIFLIEQNVRRALEIADSVYVLKAGQVILHESAALTRARPDLWDLF